MSTPSVLESLPDPPGFLGLLGPTASGKTEVAVRLCERFGTEVVSVDSMQVYRGLDVGTAKPDAATLARAPHHVIDVAEPSERYDVVRYLADVREAVADLVSRGVTPLFAGGTGFYLKALLHGVFDGPPADLELRRRLEDHARGVGEAALHAELASVDPEAAARIHANDRRRVVRALEVFEQTGRPLSDWQREWRRGPDGGGGPTARLVGLELAPEELDRRIAARTERMLEAGWVEEALAVERGPGFGPSAEQALGYREVLAHAHGELTRPELVELVRLRTRQFARRQRTWFRHFPEVRWIAAPDPDLPGDPERAVDEAAEALDLGARPERSSPG
jgi:tRNA dimethylallyltransferase